MMEGQFATGTTQAERIFTGSAAPAGPASSADARSAKTNFRQRMDVLPGYWFLIIVARMERSGMREPRIALRSIRATSCLHHPRIVPVNPGALLERPVGGVACHAGVAVPLGRAVGEVEAGLA